VTAFFVSSLEDAMLKALPSLFPNILGTSSNARVEFYDKFQREADEYDRDFMKKYDEDLNTTLIFVSVFLPSPPDRGPNWLFRTSRLVSSLRSHPLSLLTFKATYNRTSHK
jgi:hypothetical protein